MGRKVVENNEENASGLRGKILKCPHCRITFVREKWRGRHSCGRKRKFDAMVERLMEEQKDRVDVVLGQGCAPMPECNLRMDEMPPSSRVVCRLVRQVLGQDGSTGNQALRTAQAESALSSIGGKVKRDAYSWFYDAWVWSGDKEMWVAMEWMEKRGWDKM